MVALFPRCLPPRRVNMVAMILLLRSRRLRSDNDRETRTCRNEHESRKNRAPPNVIHEKTFHG